MMDKTDNLDHLFSGLFSWFNRKVWIKMEMYNLVQKIPVFQVFRSQAIRHI